MKNSARNLASLALFAWLLLASPARAAEFTFGNANPIFILDLTNAAPYPSTITVAGLTEAVDKISVTLSNLTHPYPEDLDILLVGPGGQSVVLLSDAGTGNPLSSVTNVTLTFDDLAPVQLRQFGLVARGTFRPADYPPADFFPTNAPAGPYGTNLAVFKGTNPNGEWRLFAVDDFGGGAGSISGWSLKVRAHSQLATNNTPILVADTAATGVPYPSTIAFTNVTAPITKVTATLLGLSHPYPADLDVLLVGPTGKSVVLMSDAGGGNLATKTVLTFDDSVLATLPLASALQSGSFKPTNYDGNDLFPSNAPAGPYGAALSVFNGTAANGLWRLFVVDDFPGADGGQISAWKLAISTEPLAITQQPVGATVPLGTNVSFQVSVAGVAPISYRWLLNGVDIPGAANSSLTVTNVRVQDAGSYSVVAANGAGVAVSDPAWLLLAAPVELSPDGFAQRRVLTGHAGMSLGANFFATKEPGEPFHAGKPGGSSVWYSWTAPANGIATFDTRGSTFDTLLGIYTGNTLSNLTFVARDEDHGGFRTSQTRFNAEAQHEYLIAVDGLAAQQGRFVLNWNLEVTADLLPLIFYQPDSVTVSQGSDATLTVGAAGASGVTYQWFLNGALIPGATTDTLTRTNVQIQDVGAYEVLVASGVRTALSEPGVVEIGPDPHVQSRGKIEDVYFPGPSISTGSGPFPPTTNGCDACAIPPVFISVRAGLSPQTQMLHNSDGDPTAAVEGSKCSLILNHAKFLGLQPAAGEDGEFFVDTAGSPFPTVLVVYQIVDDDGPVPGILLKCDQSDATNPRPCAVRFRGTPRTKYVAAVGGRRGEDVGGIQLNWSFGVALSIATRNSTSAVLSWLVTEPPYHLEATPALVPAAWEPFPGTPSVEDGTNKVPVPILVPASPATNRFFRLKKNSP